MKVKIYSDLHVEFASFEPGPVDADLVILAGDIHTKAQGVNWANDMFDCPVLYVCDNHEFYHGHLEITLTKMKGVSDRHAHVLNNEIFVFNQTRFLCTTGWTDFSPKFPSPQLQPVQAAGDSWVISSTALTLPLASYVSSCDKMAEL